MSTATAQAEPARKAASRRQPRRISKEEFLEEYSGKEDGYKYEWNNGVVEKTKGRQKPILQRSRRISKEEFLREYSNMEDGYKYEWNNGIIEKTKAMNQQQADFFFLLLEQFQKTAASKARGGLITETDMYTTTEQLRRPDIAFYSGEQRRLMKKGENQTASWVAEVISPTDQADKINDKLEEYFRAGVQVVWHIYPHSKKVDVYTSPDDVTICRGKTVCSGAPALPDFEISAGELFA